MFQFCPQLENYMQVLKAQHTAFWILYLSNKFSVLISTQANIIISISCKEKKNTEIPLRSLFYISICVVSQLR